MPLSRGRIRTARQRGRKVVLSAAHLRPPTGMGPSALATRTTLTIAYPEHLNRWKPLYKWFLAIPHYLVLVVLTLDALFAFLGSFFAVLFTGEYPDSLRGYLVGVYRYALRVEAFVGLLTDTYPPFQIAVA